MCVVCQALNNGLSVESLMAMANEFFWPGEKDVRKRKETVENWCATVRLHCQQLQHLLSDSPANLATFRYLPVANEFDNAFELTLHSLLYNPCGPSESFHLAKCKSREF